MREAINRQFRDVGLVVVPLDVASVDWNAIVQAALFRRPPFERGEKEKGFRDALVAECFMLAVNESPKNPSHCRVAIVTGDGLLGDMMEERTASIGNVRVLRNLDDLQSLINTLVSNVKEQFVASVREAAEAYFFTKGSKDGLYYEKEIRGRVLEQFNEKLRELPPGATSRENGTWYIGSPSFVEKKRQRIFWRTSIEIEANSFKSEWPKAASRDFGSVTSLMADPSARLSELGGRLPISSITLPILPHALGSMDPQDFRALRLDAALSGLSEKLLVSKGRSLFHVTWSVIISPKQKLSRPKIENIEWKETLWE